MGRIARLIDAGIGLVEAVIDRIGDPYALSEGLRQAGNRIAELVEECDRLHLENEELRRQLNPAPPQCDCTTGGSKCWKTR